MDFLRHTHAPASRCYSKYCPPLPLQLSRGGGFSTFLPIVSAIDCKHFNQTLFSGLKSVTFTGIGKCVYPDGGHAQSAIQKRKCFFHYRNIKRVNVMVLTE